MTARVTPRTGLAWIHAALLAIVAGLPGAGCPSSSASGKGGSGPSGERKTLTPKELVKIAKPAIVRIEVDNEAGGGVGTGFVLRADGRIVTNLHVINGATQVRVSLLDGTKLAADKVAAYDPERDLAILEVHGAGQLPILKLGDSDDVSAGDPVIAIGNPLGVFDYTVSDGLISAVRPVTGNLTILQISAPISQGSSGGPLFNSYGEVIGVATAIAGQGQNLNFGIPSNYLRALLERNDGLTFPEVNAQLAVLEGEAREKARAGTIERHVPDHPLSVLDGCSRDSVESAVDAVRSAIEIGAPLYNQGNHEACYRVYEGTAMRLESELTCKGLREAFGAGLLRASTEDNFTTKAWAMRDTFDGVLLVAKRKYPDMF